jgi:hypothetical protein
MQPSQREYENEIQAHVDDMLDESWCEDPEPDYFGQDRQEDEV